MKKSLLAVALLSAVGAVSAQSSVTLFGVVDSRVALGRGSIGDKNALASGGMNTPRIGFRGVEDLGGGMSASFWLESAVFSDDGSMGTTNTNNQANGTAGGGGLTFGRRATFSLASNWGELRIGRDYVPQYWALYFADPSGQVGVGASLPLTAGIAIYGLTGVRASNSFSYLTPASLGGFFGHAMYYLGENLRNGAATQDDGRGAGVRGGYAKGPFYAAAGYGRTEYAAGDVRMRNAVATWDFGVAKIGAQISRDSNSLVDGKGWLLGGWYRVGPGEILAAYSRYKTDAAGNPDMKKAMLGYVHNLSKRTAVYTTWARVKNSGGASLALNGATTAPNTSSSGFDLGIRHSF